MPLFPLDIRHQSFPLQCLVTAKEVRAFLDQIASEVEAFQNSWKKKLPVRTKTK